MSAPSEQPGGPHVGRYHLLRKLAAGGMGEVWLAATRGPAGFEKRVAIKRILPHLAADEDFVHRFIDEARIVVTLSHGNVVQVLDMGEEEGEYYIAMEYVPGTDLRAVLRRCAEQEEGLPAPLAVYVTSEVCRGLGYAHRKVDEQGRRLHIVHRDVSPSNVLLSWEGMVRVTDFGVASAVGRLVDSLAGRLHGKIAYMSPEQAAGEPLDARSDIYSAGIVCWELLTGRRLYDGLSDTEVLRRVQEGAVVPPSEVAAGLPPALDVVVMKALSRERSERWQRMEDFDEGLRQLLYGELQGASGAPALADYLRELFPEEFRSPSQPSLDEALRAGLPDLEQAARPEPQTLSAPRRGDSRPGLAAPPAAAATPPRPVGRWLLPLVAAGLALGYLGALPGATPSARLTVTSVPAGAEVRLAGHPVGVTPWRGGALPPATAVALDVELAGFVAHSEQLELRPGALSEVHVDLQPRADRRAEQPARTGAGPPPLPLLAGTGVPWRMPTVEANPSVDLEEPADEREGRRRPKGARASRPARPAGQGTLFLRVKPMGRVRVDGRWYASPLTGLQLPAGVSTVTVEHPGWGVSRRVKVTIRPGQQTREVVELERPPSSEGAP